MKLKTTLLLFLCSTMICAQSDQLEGEYFLQAGSQDNHLIEYKLTLRSDGTFFFHSFRDHKKGIPWVENKYGKGIWRAEGKVVSFYTDKEKDLDEKHTLDFSNSKAHFVTKPARDKTERVIKTRLKFFESEIFWIKGLDITKA